jgi:serine/threonine protein phosphatase PrpC
MEQYQAFSTTVIGSSHIKHGKECQDYSWHSLSISPQGSMALAIVADGHGADECFRSAKGAEFAATSAANGIEDFVKYLHEKTETIQGPLEDDLSGREIATKLRENLIRDGIIRAWHLALQEDYNRNPFTPAELEAAGEKYRVRYTKGEGVHKAYGSTLIACAVTPKYWFGIHIGDGRLTALYPDGSFDQPVPWDPKCFLNQTTSICDDDAAARARVYVSFHNEKASPAAVFLCSDGVDDNYPVYNNEQHLFKLYRTIALTFAEDGFESTCKQLENLADAFATKGKGDDTSIAGIIDMEAVKQAVPIWKKQIAEEEAGEAAKPSPPAPPNKPPAPAPASGAEAAQTPAAKAGETAKPSRPVAPEKRPAAAMGRGAETAQTPAAKAGEAAKPSRPAPPDKPPAAEAASGAEAAQNQAARAYEKTMHSQESELSDYGDFKSAPVDKEGENQ